MSKRKMKTDAKTRRSGKVTALPARRASAAGKVAAGKVAAGKVAAGKVADRKLSESIEKRGVPDVPESRPHSSVNS